MSQQNDFAMEYSALEKLAKEVGQMQTDFVNMLRSLDNLVESLDGQWQGKAQVEFAIAYSKLRPKLDTISEVLQNYATEISNIVSSEKYIESLNKTLYKPLLASPFYPVSYPSF